MEKNIKIVIAVLIFILAVFLLNNYLGMTGKATWFQRALNLEGGVAPSDTITITNPSSFARTNPLFAAHGTTDEGGAATTSSTDCVWTKWVTKFGSAARATLCQGGIVSESVLVSNDEELSGPSRSERIDYCADYNYGCGYVQIDTPPIPSDSSSCQHALWGKATTDTDTCYGWVDCAVVGVQYSAPDFPGQCGGCVECHSCSEPGHSCPTGTTCSSKGRCVRAETASLGSPQAGFDWSSVI